MSRGRTILIGLAAMLAVSIFVPYGWVIIPGAIALGLFGLYLWYLTVIDGNSGPRRRKEGPRPGGRRPPDTFWPR